jgi:signal transduction histidine kinase/DNA-binding response OmpR family regulator/ligand-binding sensor domain-containing protein
MPDARILRVNSTSPQGATDRPLPHRMNAASPSRESLPLLRRTLFLPLLILITGGSLSNAEPGTSSKAGEETGIPAIRNFTPKEYGKDPHNYGIVQDKNGIVYIANLSGVVQYDGVSWRRIRMPKDSWVLSLAVDSLGRVYVGSVGDFGYLAPDSAGMLHFVSLLEHVAPEHRNFAEVWRTHATSAGVYFWTRTRLFRWSGNAIRAWTSGSSFSLSSVVHDMLYVEERGRGLLMMAGDSLHGVPGSRSLSPIGVMALLAYDHRRLLVCSLRGLFLFDGKAFSPFAGEVNEFIRANTLSCAAALLDGGFAIGTYKGGVRLIDHEGRIRLALNEAAGLQNDDVKNMFCDPEGSLWLALSSGISYVRTHDPLSFFTEAQGLKGSVVSIARHQGSIYAATSQGVFHMKGAPATGKFASPVFAPVEGLSTEAFWLMSLGNTLLATTAGNGGVFSVSGEKGSLLSSQGANCYALCRSMRDTDLVYVGLKGGLEILRSSGGRWKSSGVVKGITTHGEIRSIAEDSQGAVWLGTMFQGVLRVRDLRRDAEGWTARVDSFGREHGLPDGPVNVVRVAGHVVFPTYRGHRRFDETLSRFLPDSSVSPELADTTLSASLVNVDRFGRIFNFTMDEEEVPELWTASRRDHGAYVLDKRLFRSLPEFGLFYSTFTDEDGVIWIGCSRGLVRYDPGVPKNYAPDYGTLIRRVATLAGDSVIYGGAFPAGPPATLLPFAQNAYRFEYAAPFFETGSEIRYQSMLEGFDNQWSAWSAESRKDYTALPEGSYTFRVRGRNVYEHLSKEGRFAFVILPPWYRTWWAVLMYAVSLLGGVALVVKARVRRLEKRTKDLEALVSERTGEIVEQRDKIAQQAERLQEADRLKSRFFANISHEFRTPLTLILGPLADLTARTQDSSVREEMGIMQRNATRLLQLINQLLDLSRLEAGRMTLHVSPGNFLEFVKGVVHSFSSLADQRAVNYGLHVEAASGSLSETYLDSDKIEKILVNLISNAFKFTPNGGDIEIFVRLQGDGFAIISIINAGEGIPPEHLPHIFDRFYQVDGSSTRRQDGTGIGLALTKELVETYHGTVTVESELGGTTRFTVRLPISRRLFPEGEIIEQAQGASEGTVGPELSVNDAGNSPVTFASAELPAATEPETDVLLVEDHPEVRRFIRSHLGPGYRVTEASNGREALAAAVAEIPDLVISDVMMPEMDGFELCRALKTDEKTSHIPVILLTARAAEESRIEGFQTGADEYLVKPFSPVELQVRVKNLVASRRELRKRFTSEMLLQPRGVVVTSAHATFLTRVMDVIEAHLGSEEFGVQMLSDSLNLTQRQLHRKLSAIANQSPNEFIRSFRLHRARQLLEQQAGTVSEIAFRVGFSNLSYFSKCFKEQFQVLPSSIDPGAARQ